jgi:glutamyl-tRNA synthetase
MYNHTLLRTTAKYLKLLIITEEMADAIKKTARKYALQNAVKFEGKASMGAVLGKVLSTHNDARSDIATTKRLVAEVIKEVNNTPLDKQKFQLAVEAPELVGQQHKKRREGLKALPSHKTKQYTFRFAPSPSGPLHIGHAYILLLNYLYAKKYHGKFILRIEDTNPDNIYPDAYKMIQNDAAWLTSNDVNEVIIQSERMDLYHTQALRIIEGGDAYVCTCDAEAFRAMMKKKEACPCRDQDKDEAVKRWEKMLKVYNPGEAVVRFKTDIQHKNPAMRDFPILRINDSPHPLQGEKYRVWPLMNFSVAIDDMDLGISHALRGKDHADNALRQAFIHEALQVNTPQAVSVGRINFTGTEVEISASKTRAMIESGQIEGWEDIRLPFVGAMRRRGYTPEAFQRWTTEMGTTQNDKSVDIHEFLKSLNAFNKENIDKDAERYFFVQDPVEIEIKKAPKVHIVMDKHPDHKKGGRTFETTDIFYLAKEDVDSFADNEVYRLIDCLNFTKVGDKYSFHSEEYENYKKEGKKILHWLPKKEVVVDVEVLMPDNRTVSGFGEDEIAELDVGAMVQFERFGFCKLDEINGNKYVFRFCHR